MGTIPRSTWQDDSGSGVDGTILANSELQKIYDNIDAEVKSTNYPTVTTKSITDVVMASTIFHFGGSEATYRRNTALPTGSTLDLIAPGTGVWNIDSAFLTGTFRWEAVLSAEGAGTVTISAALVNLTDDPNTAMANSTITTTTVTGARVRSGILSFAPAGTAKDYGIKLWTSNAAIGGRVNWARMIRTA